MPNRKLNVYFSILLLLCGGSVFCPSAKAQLERLVRPIHLPISKGASFFVILEVPVTIHGRLVNAYPRAMCAPVFAGSDSAEDYQRDVNLISLSKIKLSFEQEDAAKVVEKAPPLTIAIDVTDFAPPKDCVLDVVDVVQAILVCLRMDFPPGSFDESTIKIVGAKASSNLSKLEGPLWVTTREKMYEGVK